eukprot:COSAG04_NODE_22538_length_353_cov_0.811024_1_plen_71_part_10
MIVLCVCECGVPEEDLLSAGQLVQVAFFFDLRAFEGQQRGELVAVLLLHLHVGVVSTTQDQVVLHQTRKVS